MSEDIVVQLRGWSEGSSDDSRRMVWLMRQSAYTIEALRGEVERWRNNSDNKDMNIADLEAENARLKGALEAIAIKAGTSEHGGNYVAAGRTIRDIEHMADKALAGETT